MDSLLTVAFDNISSRPLAKVRKGLRQIDGLLVQICFRSSPSRLGPAIPLEELSRDLAFSEFFRLQESFEWNTASRLLACLERLLGIRSNVETDEVIVLTLNLVQGLLLLHPPSRTLFSRPIYMNLLMDLLEPSNHSDIISNTLLVLVAALLDQPRNTRVFESADGLLTISSLFKSRDTPQQIKLRLVDFLHFYLMPETPHPPALPTIRPVGAVDTGSAKSDSSSSTVGDTHFKNTTEKQQILSRYLDHVEDLVNDMQQTAPQGRGLAASLIS